MLHHLCAPSNYPEFFNFRIAHLFLNLLMELIQSSATARLQRSEIASFET
jgi:hypothetical protein